MAGEVVMLNSLAGGDLSAKIPTQNNIALSTRLVFLSQREKESEREMINQVSKSTFRFSNVNVLSVCQ